MRKIVFTGLFASLVAVSPLQAMAAGSGHRTENKAAAMTAKVRNARAAVVDTRPAAIYAPSAQSYEWSAPAGH